MKKSNDKSETGTSKGSLGNLIEEGKVVPISKSPAKEASDLPNQKETKISKRDLYSLVSDLLDLNAGGIARFFVIENPSSKYLVVADGNELSVIDDSVAAGAILRACQTNQRWIEKGLMQLFTDKDAKEALHFWKNTTTKKLINEKDIKPIIFADQDEWTWRKLPFKLQQPDLDTSCPAWEEILGRMTQPQAFMDFVASIFLEDSDRSQYLWLFGDGGNGKSSITSVLHDILGNAALNDVAVVSRWTAGSWAGKRLVYFPDTNNFQFVTSGTFKAATGSDNMTVEKKNRDAVSIKPQAKFIFTSNTKPNITGGESDKRRMILCELSKVGVKPMPAAYYHNLLKSEFPLFLSTCIDSFVSKYSAGEVIEVDQSVAEDLALENETEFEAVVEEFLNINPEGHTTVAEMHRIARCAGWKGGSSDPAYRRFTAYLRRSYGAKMTTVRNGKKVSRVWAGIVPKGVVPRM